MFLSPETRPVLCEGLGIDDAIWVRGRGWGMVLSFASPESLANIQVAEAFHRWADDLLADVERAGESPKPRPRKLQQLLKSATPEVALAASFHVGEPICQRAMRTDQRDSKDAGSEPNGLELRTD
ncbi:MAG TPA: hypothetical protein VI076_00170 [Actinopolymorphaceae bacterium]